MLGAMAGHDTLRDQLAHGAKALMRMFQPGAKPAGNGAGEAAKNRFWALRDVSFELGEGEVLGVVGRNGAGKSTLLKILSQITEPTEGEILVRGRVASLLEVGTGFHPELTGRENVYLNGAVLGMTRREIRAKFDEIVAFSEVENFLDTPVKRYSSGMYVRLAFAVAAHLEPDILVVDEVLAVGDAAFQRKCLGKMGTAARQGRTVLLVSHNIGVITSLCSRAILLEAGRLVAQGPARDIAGGYLAMIRDSAGLEWTGPAGDENFRLDTVRVRSESGSAFHTHEEIRVEIRGEILKPIYLVGGIELWSERHGLLAYSAYDDALGPPYDEVPPGPFAWQVTIPPHTLTAGTYEIRPDIGNFRLKRAINGPGTVRFTVQNTEGLGRRNDHWKDLLRPGWEWRRIGPHPPVDAGIAGSGS
jgi:lipopolysaccharide transport system ATP-binding protein